LARSFDLFTARLDEILRQYFWLQSGWL